MGKGGDGKGALPPFGQPKAKAKALTDEEKAEIQKQRDEAKALYAAKKAQEKAHMEFLMTVPTGTPGKIDKVDWSKAERQVILGGGTTIVKMEDGKCICIRRPKYAAGEVIGKALARVVGVKTLISRAVHADDEEYKEIVEMTAKTQLFVDDTPMLWESLIAELLEMSPEGIPTEVKRPFVDKYEYTEPTRATADLKTNEKAKGTVFVEEFLPGVGFHMLCGEMAPEVLKDLGKWGALTAILQQSNMFPLPVWKESGSLNNIMRFTADPKMMIALELAPMPLQGEDLAEYNKRLAQLVREELGIDGVKEEWKGYKVVKDQWKKELTMILDTGGWSCSAKEMDIVMEGFHEGLKAIAYAYDNEEVKRALELALEDCAKIVAFDDTGFSGQACADFVTATIKTVAEAAGKKK